MYMGFLPRGSEVVRCGPCLPDDTSGWERSRSFVLVYSVSTSTWHRWTVVIYLVEQASIISSFYETRWDFPKRTSSQAQAIRKAEGRAAEVVVSGV